MSNYLIESVNDIKHCLYINLTSRVDRMAHIEKELKGIGIHPTRFNAIKMTNGRVGCSMSHLKCLQIAKRNNWPYVMICEDDLMILDKQKFINHINKFFKIHGKYDFHIDNQHNTDTNTDTDTAISSQSSSQSSNKWNVLLLAGNNVPPYLKIDDTCIQVSFCQTTTGYIVKQSYYDILMQNIKTGIELLMKNPDQHIDYAIDKYWIRLQKEHTWYMLAPVVAVQREDYSDIEQRKTNYENIMKDIDKPHLIHYQKHLEKQQRAKASMLSAIPSISVIPSIPSIPIHFKK
jgi:GR25 family glycosyltransferase involved in LPS biosynthesis